MALSIVSWNGNALQGATYRARIYRDQVPFKREAATQWHSPLGRYPEFTGYEDVRRIISLKIAVLTSYTVNQEQLSRWFRPGITGILVMNVDGVDRLLDATVKHIIPYDGSNNEFTVALECGEDWRSKAQFVNQDITASPSLVTVTNNGNVRERKAVIRIQPHTFKAAATGYRFAKPVIIANRAPFALSNYAIDFTGGGWNHAAEVTAVRSLASGNDVRPFKNGLEIPRWPGEGTAQGFNTVGTRLWGNVDFQAGRSIRTLNAVTATSPLNGEDLEIVRGGTVGLPTDRGAVSINGEVIEYSGLTEFNAEGHAALLSIVRGARHTTVGVHPADSIGWWVEHEFHIVYGFTGAGIPDVRPDLKPLLDLSSTTISNSQLEWLQFADDRYPQRSMSWQRALMTSYPNFDAILEASDDPLTEMTAEYREAGRVAGRPNYNTWKRSFPTGLEESQPSAFRSLMSQAFSGTTVTVTKPPGTVEGDVLICVLAWAADPGAVTPPTGFTLLSAEDNTSFLKTYVKYATASEPVNYVWSWVTTRAGFCAIYGTQNAAGVKLLAKGDSPTSTVSLPGNITPTVSPTWIVTVAVKTTTGAFTPPTGFTERFEAGSNIGLEISDAYYTGGRNERWLLTGAIGPNSTGTYTVLQIPIRGPIRYTKSIASSLALAHYGVDIDGNKVMTGYDFNEGDTPAAQDFSYNGAEQQFPVPAGVTEVNVLAKGAGLYGYGGRIQAKLAVTPFEILRIYVGGINGYNGGGAGGGGGIAGFVGGGATDIRQGGSGLAQRKIVAGGGGGDGATNSGGPGGRGGNAGPSLSSDGSGGSASYSPLFWGGGGGGQGQIGSGGSSGTAGQNSGTVGSVGILGTGGGGGTGFGGGGGGGGGIYGGGGGGGGGTQDFPDENNNPQASFFPGGGGGGGSSGVLGSGVTAVQDLGSFNFGNGELTISCVLPSASPPNSYVPRIASPTYEHEFVTVSPIAARPPEGGPIAAQAMGTGSTTDGQQFQTGVRLSYLSAVRLRLESAVSGNCLAYLYSDNSDVPGDLLATSALTPVIASTTEHDLTMNFSPTVPLIAGKKYWVMFTNSTPAATYQYVTMPYPFKSKVANVVYSTRALRLALILTPDNVEDFDGYARSDDGATNRIDTVVAKLDSISVPYVAALAHHGVYQLDGRIVNLRTGLAIKFNDLICELGEVIEIDVWRRAVRNLSAGPYRMNFTGGVVKNYSARTVTIAAGRIQQNVKNLITEEQSWVATRFNVNWANTANPYGGLAIPVWKWWKDSNNYIAIEYVPATDQWRLTRSQTAGTANVLSAVQSFSSGTDLTIIAAWERGTLKISINGVVFVTTAAVNIPDLQTVKQLDIGSDAGATWINADYHWQILGDGSLTNADAAMIHGYGNNKPDFDTLKDDLPNQASPTAIWIGWNESFQREGAGEYDKGLSRSHTVAPTDPTNWLELEPGVNDLHYEEPGVIGLNLEVRHKDRWL